MSITLPPVSTGTAKPDSSPSQWPPAKPAEKAAQPGRSLVAKVGDKSAQPTGRKLLNSADNVDPALLAAAKKEGPIESFVFSATLHTNRSIKIQAKGHDGKWHDVQKFPDSRFPVGVNDDSLRDDRYFEIPRAKFGALDLKKRLKFPEIRAIDTDSKQIEYAHPDYHDGGRMHTFMFGTELSIWVHKKYKS